MIELAMIFALGVMVAGLLFLLLLPVLSRRAIRLATRRLQARVPLSMTEIMAERDQIRAEHAMAARRLEQKIEALAETKADLMSRNGRQATQNLVLVQDLATARGRIEDLEAELAATTARAVEAQGTLGAQVQLLHDSLGLAERRLDILRATKAELATAEGQVDAHRATIAGLETRSTGQDLRIRIALSQAAKSAEDLSRAQATIESLNAERDVLRAEAALMTEEQEVMLAQVAAERQQVLRGERRYAEQASQLASLAARVAEQAGDIAALQRFLTAANSKRDALQAERDRLTQATEPAERAPHPMPAASGPAVASPVPADDVDLAVLRDAITFVAAELLRAGEASTHHNGVAVPEQAVLPFVAALPRQDIAGVQ